MRANQDIPVKLMKVEYPAVTPGMQREQVKPLHAAYVTKGEGETEYHTRSTGEGLQCDPGFRGNFRHPFWGPCFRPNFRARTSHTMNLGSSSGLQLECAGPTPQTLGPPRDLSYNARVRHHKPRVLHYSARVRHHKPRVLHYSARVRHNKPRVLLGSSVRVRGSDTPFGFYNVLQQRQANPIYVCDR